MRKKKIYMTDKIVNKFKIYLKITKEAAENTVKKYLSDMKAFQTFLSGEEVSKEKLLEWKEHLSRNYALSSVNSKIAAINTFLEFMGLSHLKLKALKIQKKLFIDENKQLTKKEYFILVRTAKKQKKEKLALIMETIASSGIRISELKYIRVSALKKRKIEISCKGKIRIILLPKGLTEKLLTYSKKIDKKTGSIFTSKTGKPMDRSNIWRELKKLCKTADVNSKKVYPHSFRRLFASTFYKIEKDIVKLADFLGHSSIDTTRIYIKDSIHSYFRKIEKLDLFIT